MSETPVSPDHMPNADNLWRFLQSDQKPAPEGMSFIARLGLTIRLAHWWSFKIPPAMAIVYTLAWTLDIPLHQLVIPALSLCLAGITAGIFASILNDLIDFHQDWVAGKTTGVLTSVV